MLMLTLCMSFDAIYAKTHNLRSKEPDTQLSNHFSTKIQLHIHLHIHARGTNAY